MRASIIPYIIIAALLATIFFMQQCKNDVTTPIVNTVTKIDTQYITQTKTVYIDTGTKVDSKVGVIPVKYYPDTNCAKLLAQYKELLNDYFVVNKYLDTIRNDSSYVVQSCQVSQNILYNCRYDFALKYPFVRETITTTITNPPRRQFYAGFETGANTALNSLTFDAGLLYKNRKDNITGISIGTDTRSQELNFRVKYYWKIKLRND